MTEIDRYKAQLQDSISRISRLDRCQFSQSVDFDGLIQQSEKTLNNIDSDLAAVQNAAPVLFPSLKGGALDKEAGTAIADIFREWRVKAPSTAAIFCIAAQKLNISPEAPYLHAALLSAIAADVPNNNPYHSQHHSREVSCAMVRLLYAHQQLSTPLPEQALLEGMSAAAGHDLLHDGKTNQNIQYRLEDRSARALQPFLKAGNVDKKDSDDIHAMIRTTDITVISDSISPHTALKRFFAGAALTPPPGIERIFADKELCLLAALLGDADLTPSSATDPAFSRMMSGYVNQENPSVADTPASTERFIEFVIGGRYNTAAGRAVGQAALVNILTKMQNNPGIKPPSP